MSYSFTEKKRIRKDFSKSEVVVDVPFLLKTQVESYNKFLGLVEEAKCGLDEALNSVFPIESYSGYAKLDFVSVKVDKPVFNVVECKLRGLTYGAAIKAKVQLIIYDKESSARKKKLKYVKEQEVYLGDLPLMTPNGTFVINGTERVIAVSYTHLTLPTKA